MCIRPQHPDFALNATLLLVLLIAGLAPVSAAPTVAAAQALSVDGSDPAASDTTCMPCKTIQGALNLAGPGDGITVAPGSYPETLTVTQSVSITGGVPLRPGEQGPTIVDAGGTGRVVTIPNVVPCSLLRIWRGNVSALKTYSVFGNGVQPSRRYSHLRPCEERRGEDPV